MMLQRIENRLFDDMTRRIHHVEATAPANADGLTAEVYAQMRGEFQIAPPLTLHSVTPPLLAAVWAIGRESQIATGLVGRDLKEAVAGAVSRINQCPYCVDVHTAMVQATTGNTAASAIRSDKPDEIADEKMARLVRWAAATRTPTAAILASPPFTADEAPEIIGTALSYHYVNRMVHVFLDASPLPITRPGRAQDLARRVFGATFAKRIVQRSAEPGASLRFLPTSELPSEFAWAAPNAAIAAAFSGLAAVADEAGHRAMGPAALDLVAERIDSWDGEDPGLGRQWVDEAIAPSLPQIRPRPDLACSLPWRAIRSTTM